MLLPNFYVPSVAMKMMEFVGFPKESIASERAETGFGLEIHIVLLRAGLALGG
jgi:hypothetical protein